MRRETSRPINFFTNIYLKLKQMRVPIGIVLPIKLYQDTFPKY
jgi:hypothetical protein